VQALADALGAPLRLFTAAELEAQAERLAHPSDVVFAATGCHGVAEGAALAAAGPAGALVVAKTKSEHATCALARAPAPIDPDRVGRALGRLAIIGLGPGPACWRTPEARTLLDDAQDWVGYRGYLDLLGRPHGKALHGFALGEEAMRAQKALNLAAAGRRVALVSSGDAGIYAMASLVFELVERCDRPAWQQIRITVSPGISALQAAAARAGAPLGHDFCAISLSDLLTPWPVIKRRLEAAAAGDFVTVLYNPASPRRREGLERALAILGAARPPDTPVIHARNLGRSAESVELCRLEAFDPAPVDMLSLVVVGACQTRLVEGRGRKAFVYTPRGYLAGKNG
jgi:cobalt-precorrin 5A hydrolase/precorrin-3B C17-methyltransferase